MSDARWFEVEADIDAAIRHFRQSVELYRKGGFDAPGLDGYQAEMALMHALQSAHTSLEGGFWRSGTSLIRLKTNAANNGWS